jgi:hypothetical protein
MRNYSECFLKKCTSTDCVIKSLCKPGSPERIKEKWQSNRVVNGGHHTCVWIGNVKFYPTICNNTEGLLELNIRTHFLIYVKPIPPLIFHTIPTVNFSGH